MLADVKRPGAPHMEIIGTQAFGDVQAFHQTSLLPHCSYSSV